MKKNLNEREFVILIYRFGLKDSIPRTQQFVADKLGISRSYISRIEKKGFEQTQKRYQKEQYSVLIR